MIVTLNEIQRSCQKALSGAGAPPGIDDDAGAAVAWLESRGLAALGGVVAALERWAGDPGAAVIGGTAAGMFDAGGRSAVFLGPGLIDAVVSSATSQKSSRLDIRALTEPQFLIPLAESLCGLGWSFDIAWTAGGQASGTGAQLDSTAGVTLLGDWSRVPAGPAEVVVHCQEAGQAPFDSRLPVACGATELGARRAASLSTGLAVEDALWNKVSRYARRTLVPASAESRARGAGPGSSDNE